MGKLVGRYVGCVHDVSRDEMTGNGVNKVV